MNQASSKDIPVQSLFHFLLWYPINFLKVLWVSKQKAWSQPGLNNTMVNIPHTVAFLCSPLRMSWPGTEDMAWSPSVRSWSSGYTCPVTASHPFPQKSISYNSERPHKKRKCQVSQAILCSLQGRRSALRLRIDPETLSNDKCQNIKPKKTR